ncbi:DUF2796 domain-containing protein [Roseobacter sp.]|uniref:zinc uptake protein ZrgA n=1 Tax=Roseobacter sp. TaxID=1907202 RepID=UPI003298B624
MKPMSFLAVTVIAAAPALADETRQLDAHEHGVGQLDIAFDGSQIAMELHAPGADIVGFEYAATRAEDRAAVDAAVATLARPLDLFVLPQAAGCSVVQASAELESDHADDDHDDHDHEDHADEDHDDHGHDDHADEDHDDHGHDDHADEDHDDHGHDDHADDDHGHDEHAHDDHADAAGHTEFHAEYLLTCADTTAVTDITFAYFETFPNALEVEVQVVSSTGAASFEVPRAAPTLDLRSLF